jgi:hypothetical protein
MAEFVQQHAGEQGENEADTGDHAVQAFARDPVAHRQPRDQHQEGKMDAQFHTIDSCDFPGPFHCLISFSFRFPFAFLSLTADGGQAITYFGFERACG